MAAKIDQICSENGTAFVEMDIAHDCIDPAVGSVINNILFGYRFDGVVFSSSFAHFYRKLLPNCIFRSAEKNFIC